jgi:lipopolysaccharide exporter
MTCAQESMPKTQAQPPEPGPIGLSRARGRFMTHVLALMTGNGIAQAVQFSGTLALARLCAPESFGIFALFLTVVSLFSVLGGGRYELAIMLPDSDEEAGNVLFLATFVVLGIAGVSALTLSLFHGSLDRLFGGAEAIFWPGSIPLALFVNAFWGVLTYWFGRMKRFRSVALSRVWQSGGTVAAQVGLLGLHLSGGRALIDGWIIGQSLAMLYLVVEGLHLDGHFLIRTHSLPLIRRASRRYRDFPIYKAPYSFVSNGGSQLVLVILKLFSNLTSVGLFSLANRAVYLPTTLIASSLSQVFYEKAATELRSGRLEHFVTRLLRLQAALGAPLLVLTAFEGKLLFGFLFGARWTEAGVYASLMAFAGYCYFLSSWLDRLFDVQERQRFSLILEVSGNVASLGGLYLTLWLTRDTVLAVGVFAGLEAIYTLTWLWFAYRVAGFHPAGLLLVGKAVLVWGGITAVVLGALHSVFRPWTAFLASFFVVFLIEAVCVVRSLRGDRVSEATAWLRALRARPTTPAV